MESGPSLFDGLKRRKGVLRKQIIETLAAEEATRNSDQLLTVRIWERYYPKLVCRMPEQFTNVREPFVFISDVLKLPREDNVKRIRAVIQNVEHRYLPTDPAVRRRRKISEEAWRSFLGESTSHLRL